jgi:general secretion pathway protein H
MNHRHQHRTATGFTLVEVLVVVLIIGVLVTFASLSIGSRAVSDKVDTEAARMKQLFQLAQEEAELRGIEFGFRYTDAGYEFLALGGNGAWARIGDGPLRARALPPPTEFSLRVEGRPVPPAQAATIKPARASKGDDEDQHEDGAATSTDAPALQPQILILSSGELTAFELDISAEELDYLQHIEGNIVGKVTLQRRELKR